MTVDVLQRYQVWVYLAAISVGLGLSMVAPRVAPGLELLIWPALALLLYVTFTQVPLTHLPEAFRDLRFMSGVLLGNFLVVPLSVGLLLVLAPPGDAAVRLGIVLVLLVPCTDWFITFSHLGGGDARRAIAVTPVLLLLQLGLLPLYLWLFMGDSFTEMLAVGHVVTVLVTLIVVPLAAAFLTERWAERAPRRSMVVERLGWAPVPLLAVVVFLVASSQATAVRSALPLMTQVVGIFVAYLVLAALLAVVIGRLFGLPPRPSRTLVFSMGTRNSFLVLPFALVLPEPWQAAAVVIVVQTLVELFGMLVYLRAVPHLLPDAARLA